MSKLPQAHKFIDLSDYGRPVARVIANSLRNTNFTPIHVTLAFFITGLIGILCILYNNYRAAAFFLILKSVLDAADGELARIRHTPSYTGRFLDSIADIILNALIFAAIWHISNSTIWATLVAFVGLQLQCTLYNYYYVILRNKLNGDMTSRVFENETPVALKNEKQSHVNITFRFYKILYGSFDKIIYAFDKNASKGKTIPNWLMTAVSTFGLGFQLLIIAILLVCGLKNYIIPFFIGYSAMMFVFIAIRKSL